MSKKLKFVNQCMHLNKHRSDYDMIARTSSKVFHVRLNAMFPQTSPLNVWLVSWIAILTKHQLQMAVPFCKWIYIYIYIYIYYKIYAMNKSYEAFFARQLLCMQVILCVMKVTSWKVKVANMFVMLIIWCKIQEEGLQNLSTNFSDSRLWVFSWILRNICSKSKWTFS